MARFVEGLELDAQDRGVDEVLLEQVWRASAMVRVLALRVAELGEEGLTAPNHIGDEGEHPLAGMLREWTAQAARLSKLALDAGFEERKIELAEGQAQQLADVLRKAMAGLVELMAETLHRLAPEVASAELRQLESAVPAVLRRAIEGVGLVEVVES